MLLPGIVSLPVDALVPAVIGHAVPLSAPIEEAKSAGRGLTMILVMFISISVSLLASFARQQGWFWEMLSVETVVAAILYLLMHSALARVRCKSAE